MTSRLAALTREIDPELVRLDALAQAYRLPVFYWEHPDADHLFVGFGRAWEHESDAGPDRVRSAAAATRALFSELEMHRDEDAPLPRVAAGFSFADVDEPSRDPGANSWDEFPAGSVVLPSVAFIRREGRAWVTVAAPAGPSEGGVLESAADAAVESLQPFAHGPASATPFGPAATEPNGEESFRNLVKQAVAEVESGKLAKVVAARSAQVEGAADPWRILGALRRRYPSCVVYGAFRGESVFVGASPELLVKAEQGQVSSVALAGTVGRGADPVGDDRLAERLRHDPKELAEHQYVVQGLRAALHEAGVVVDPPQPVEIVRLANVQHLSSPVTGIAPAGKGVLDIVDAVHPTPAVAGLPRRAALEWLAENEVLDRGWYAGPIGYVDASLDGSFRVALRCALIRGDRARVFAGAGIVAGSEPDRELAETNEKLRAMLDALRAG